MVRPSAFAVFRLMTDREDESTTAVLTLEVQCRHNPRGFQSSTGVVAAFSVSCRMRAKLRRTSWPMAWMIMGTSARTATPSPARPKIGPSGVSRHCSPLTMNQASGPGCLCTNSRALGGMSSPHTERCIPIPSGRAPRGQRLPRVSHQPPASPPARW